MINRTKWKHYINMADIFRDEELTFTQRRDTIVGRLKADDWLTDNADDELIDILDELTYTDNEEWFDLVWDAFYDWADCEKLWLNTLGL